jgi:hypothetical protein
MTDINKALAFAKECLTWIDVSVHHDTDGRRVFGKHEGTADSFNPDSAWEIQEVLEQFLGNRFFISIGRNTTSLFRWRVIVGPQNLLGKPALFDHGHGDADDMLDAIFTACIEAARLYPHA